MSESSNQIRFPYVWPFVILAWLCFLLLCKEWAFHFLSVDMELKEMVPLLEMEQLCVFLIICSFFFKSCGGDDCMEYI